MIYLIYGNKHNEVRAKVRSIEGAQITKRPDALSFRVTEENWKDTNLDELLGGQGLFVQKYIVIFDHLLRTDETSDALFERLKDFQNSEHIFIFSESELTKEILKKFEKKAEKIQEISSVKEKKEEKFNIFSLTDALGRKDKKELWTLYQKALLSGVSAEEIHPILFWQIKAMLGAVSAGTPAEANLNPFVYKKAQGFARNFSQGELQKISSNLVDIYHHARRGIVEFDIALERLMLGM